MTEVKNQINALEGKLNHMSNTAEDSWGEIQAGIDKSLIDLKDAVNKATHELDV